MIYVTILLGVLLAAAAGKIYMLKKTAREIADAFAERLAADTNTVMDISSRDKDMMYLADSLNKQLRAVRKEHLQYHQGDTELKTAITNISHDIRTPLTAIYGYLDLMQKTDDPSKHARYIAIMKDRAEFMKQLTDELFSYSVIISDGNGGAEEEVFINRVLAESISSFYPALSEKGITPDISITDKRIVRKLDRAALCRVFANLLNNAVKYSDGDLSVTLSDSGEIFFCNSAKELSRIDVQQLFDRFYTVESAHHSTGLGLSIAKTLVERMGGRITAEYEEGRLEVRISI